MGDGTALGAPARPLRVLQVTKSLGRGGAERLVVDLVASSDRARFAHEVAYVLASEDALVPDLEARGVPVRPLGASGNADLRWLAALRRLLAGGEYDVVHFHLPYAAALGQAVVASLPGARRPGVVYTEHSLWDRTHLAVRVLLRLSLTLRSDEPIVAVSRAAFDALPSRVRSRARVVVHGIDVAHASELVASRSEVRAAVRRELDLAPHEVLLLNVANLRIEKGHDVLLDAARLLADRAVPARVVVAGGGPRRDELVARRDALGLGGTVSFLGARTDVLRLLVAADVFVLASRHEGLPVTVMEASALGVPTVATAVGGVPEVLTDGSDALLVPPGDPAALAGALERVAADPGLRDSLGASLAAGAGRFDIRAAVEEMARVYAQVAPR